MTDQIRPEYGIRRVITANVNYGGIILTQVDDQNRDEEMNCCGGIIECDDDCKCERCMENKAQNYWDAMMDTYD